MKKHTKIYFDSFGYPPDPSIYIPCEIGKNEYNNCLNKATDIHHINARGMGGSNDKDRIENLMALCRNCHNDYGDIKKYKEFLFAIHRKRMDQENIAHEDFS